MVITPNKRNQKPDFEPHHMYMFMIIAVIILLIGIIAIVYYLIPGECETKECFIDKANNCKKATYIQDDEGTIYEFSANNCQVEKKVAKISDSEPEIIKLMFENKTFVCSYEEGAFDERLLTTLLSGLERCEGDLKTSLYELALAQYELNLEVYEI